MTTDQTAVHHCPCCGEELGPGRRILLYLASLPKAEDRNDPNAVQRAPVSIIKATGGAQATVYDVLHQLEAAGLVERTGWTVRVYLKGAANAYRLTAAGQDIADRLRAEGVTF